MAIKKYGVIYYDQPTNNWIISEAQPHVCIKFKSIFARVNKNSRVPFEIPNTPENCADLKWFMDRYPMAIKVRDENLLKRGKSQYEFNINALEAILMPKYKPRHISLKDGFKARMYQLKGAQLQLKTKRMLLADDYGLGKTLTAILCMLDPGTLPALVVVETHTQIQWMEEINKFTDLIAHAITVTSPYNLPEADVYVIKYSCLRGWVDILTSGFLKSVFYDECQALRNIGSDKAQSAKKISDAVDICMGLSATPIYNYGNEIFNVMNVIKPGCLGEMESFLREWTSDLKQVRDPKALGSYLRDNFLLLRRTREEVGMELPVINKIIHEVDHDEDMAQKEYDLLASLAIKVTSGNFYEAGRAARELDIHMRQVTGISKAREVAAYIKLLLLAGEQVLVGAWHREVYTILQEELAAFNPVMFTGSESPKQKHESKKKFVSGESRVMFMSLRSGAGLDGLQVACRYVVKAELDWSPKVHDQFIARVDRPGQLNQVTAIYCVSDFGSDPLIIDILGIKTFQSSGIVDPLAVVQEQYSDASRIKLLAEDYMKKNNVHGIQGQELQTEDVGVGY